MAFCPKCGAENKDNANFCIKCGNTLSIGEQIIEPTHGYSMQQASNQGKSPVVPVLLNFFIIWGLGYWYLGIKKVFGVPWYMLFVAQIFVYILAVATAGIFFVIGLLINIALAYDVYQKAMLKPGFVPID